MPPPEALTAEVLDGLMGPAVGAFFDVDGTVIDGRSALSIFKHRLRTLDIGPEELARTLPFGLGWGVRDDACEELVARGLGAWEGRSVDELEELGERWFVQDIAGSLYPEGWALVQARHHRGHTVVLASSATRFQIEPLARELGVEHVLCTPVETEAGILSGRLGGPALWGTGKARAVREFAAEHGVDLRRSYAYSNGDEDVPFPETVGRPRAVNPQKRLEHVARERGWPVHPFANRGRPAVATLARSSVAYWGMAVGFGTGVGIGLIQRSRQAGADVGFSVGSELALAIAGVRLNVQGAEHLWSQRPAVFIFNHQSGLDLLVAGKLLRGEFTGVARKQAANVPVIGQFLRFAQIAFVDRGNTQQAREALAPAVERVRAGLSLAIAPEGTRSCTPRFGPFKKGAFHIAMQAGVPIVPVVIRNAGEVMWRNAKTVRPGIVDVVVQPPMSVADWDVEDLDERVADVRALFVETLERWPGDPGTRRVAQPAVKAVR